MIGRPHHAPTPTKRATNTGARAVPRPSRALRVRTALSTPSGWKAAVNVLRAGTTSPKPAPSDAVAARSRP